MEKNFNAAGVSEFKYLGRTSANGTSLELTWTNSGFEFNFRGDSFTLFFNPYAGDGQPAYIKVIVDGASQRFAVSDGREAVIAEGIGDKCHNARVMRITEGEVPLSVKSVRVSGKNPELLERPADSAVRLEFIGDSLTCGYGVLGDPASDGFYTYEEDGTSAYAYMVAEALGADASYVCASGKGMVCNCMGNRGYEVPLWYDYESRNGGTWDHSSFEPDVVVINIGTNDAWGGADKAEFKATSLAFLSELRKKHPNAAILWAFGFMGTDLVGTVRETIKEFNKTHGNAYFYNIPPIFGKSGETGAVGHPSVKANRRLARSIERELRGIIRV